MLDNVTRRASNTQANHFGRDTFPRFLLVTAGDHVGKRAHVARGQANGVESGFFQVTASALELDKFFVNAVAGAIESDVIVDLWDQILGHGEAMGIMPCSFTCLDKIRVEATLLFYPYDMTERNTPWEVGLGWAIARSGADFRGKAAVLAAEGKEKVTLAGIAVDHDEALEGGDKLLQDGREVGVVNSPAYSHRMRKSLALCHVAPGLAVPGTRFAVAGEEISTTAVVEPIPFYDPEKSRTHAD